MLIELRNELHSTKESLSRAEAAANQKSNEVQIVADQLQRAQAAAQQAQEALDRERALREEAEAAQQRVMEQLTETMANDDSFFERSMERQRRNAKGVLAERAEAQRQEEVHNAQLMEERRRWEAAEAARRSVEDLLAQERQRRQAVEVELEAARQVHSQLPGAAALPAASTYSNGQMVGAGGTASATSASEPDGTWYFLDATNSCRGPYTSSTMRAWLSQGYFPSNTHVRNSSMPSWVLISQLGSQPF